jgi:uncharacterized protein YcbK (DUF882 family)
MLRKHFSKTELACKHCGELPPNGMSDMLLDGLEELRKRVRKPVIINSGYRCPYWNKHEGGVYNSQHVLGAAADICVPGMNVYKLADLCLEIFDGVGIYENDDFVHVDMRSDGTEVGKYLWFK